MRIPSGQKQSKTSQPHKFQQTETSEGTYAQDHRSEAKGHQSLQMKANNSPQVTQLKSLQSKANQSTDTIQKASKNSLSLADAKSQIIKATKGWGTDEDEVYSAIRKCSSRKSLARDAQVMAAIRGDMSGHELWRCFFLMEYGSESNYPSAVSKLWKATNGMGTDEDALFAALNTMDTRAKNMFGLREILFSELSGDDLQKALDLMTTSDSMKGNLFGSATPGKEELVISEARLKPMIYSRFKGSSTDRLKAAMATLYQKPGGQRLKDALAEVESIRGLPKGSGLAQYTKAMKKQADGVKYYTKKKQAKGLMVDLKKDHPSPSLDMGKHESFSASSAQLRFGKVLGDVFGLDAVFGSLVSPTGGLAGPGNERVMGVADGSAVATHGAIHDAAGYLYNCHGIGPGYDYLQKEPGSEASNPLAGQTNMGWWMDEFEKAGHTNGLMEKILRSKAPIGAAFSKVYSRLNTKQKKEALKILCDTFTITLKLGGLSNSDRIQKVTELMKSCGGSEKTIMANYFYNNNGWGSSSTIHKLMKPHVSAKVYRAYVSRMSAASSPIIF